MAKRLLSYQKKGEPRWSWALYYSGYAGFRFHRVRDNTSRRWNVFFDIPVVGGLSLYVQDIP